MKTGQKF